MSGYANPDLLVETDWLATHLQDPDLRVMDVRWSASHWAKAREPGYPVIVHGRGIGPGEGGTSNTAYFIVKFPKGQMQP